MSSPFLLGRGVKWCNRQQVQGGERQPLSSESYHSTYTAPWMGWEC